MSAAVRQAIAEAATTVDGINVTPYFRQTTKAGEGMVRHDRTAYPNRFGGVVTWQVLVLLPQDIAAAEKYLEDKAPALLEAVSDHLVITSMAPQQLALDTGQVPCVVIEGHREEE